MADKRGQSTHPDKHTDFQRNFSGQAEGSYLQHNDGSNVNKPPTVPFAQRVNRDAPGALKGGKRRRSGTKRRSRSA